MHKKYAACLRHSLVFIALAQRIKIHCYKILRAYSSGFIINITGISNPQKIRDNMLISTKDNGNGIPTQIREKIFQPFFTTKPTGQGTGLGLSLTYDILKAHGGEITVETKDGEGAEFIINLPYRYQ
ncbi:MAG TPA: ATP-binding protein [Chryseolinea sp.]